MVRSYRDMWRTFMLWLIRWPTTAKAFSSEIVSSKSCLLEWRFCSSEPNNIQYTLWQQASPRKKKTAWTHTEFLKPPINQMHSWMRNRSLDSPRRSVLVKLTNGNLIPRQHNPPAMPNYPTERANVRDYIYRVEFSPTSSLRIGAGASAALQRPPQSNLAAEGRDFDVLKVDLTCVYGLINLGWKAVKRADWRREGTDRRVFPLTWAAAEHVLYIIWRQWE